MTKRLLYIFEGAPELYQKWCEGTEPETHLFGVPHLEELGWTVTIRDFMEFRGFRGLWKLCRLARGYDVILSPLGINLLLLPTLIRSATPWVMLHIDVVNVYERMRARWKRALFRCALRRAGAHICLADFQNDFLVSLGIPVGLIEVVPLGGDPKFYHTVHPTEEFIFAVGRDTGRDFGTLVEAVRGLPCKVVIATSRKIIATLPPLPANIEVKENTPLLVTRDLLARAIAVVIPSHASGGSDCSGQTVLLDAWATGKAVVVSEREWVKTYVKSGEDALLVPPGNVEAIHNALQYLLDHPAERHELARNGHERLLREFTSAKMGEHLGVVLSKLITHTYAH